MIPYETDEGWRPMIDKMVEDIRFVDPDVQFLQIKEKWGLLRVYISGNDDAQDIVDKYEELSETVCERCGSTEEVTTKGPGWLRTLCAGCRDA